MRQNSDHGNLDDRRAERGEQPRLVGSPAATENWPLAAPGWFVAIAKQ